MEEFVTEIQHNIEVANEETNSSCRFRELFIKTISSMPTKIDIVDQCDENGDVVFEVSMKSIGISYEMRDIYKNELSSAFFANLIGEILVRENIDKFANIITNLKGNYLEKVNKCSHKVFGTKIYKDKLILRFHISLIQDILMEDFRKNLV